MQDHDITQGKGRSLDFFKYIGRQLKDRQGVAIKKVPKQLVAIVKIIKASKRGITRVNLVKRIGESKISSRVPAAVLCEQEAKMIEYGYIAVTHYGHKPKLLGGKEFDSSSVRVTTHGDEPAKCAKLRKSGNLVR